MMREKLYQYTVRFTSVVDYGTKLDDILSGKTAPPPGGARVDVAFEGEATGKLAGKLKGIDYLNVRADGRLELNLRGEMVTPEGARIAVEATGVGTPQPGSPVAQLRESVKLTTSHPDYAWVNALQIWAPGTVDLSTGTVEIEGFAA